MIQDGIPTLNLGNTIPVHYKYSSKLSRTVHIEENDANDN